jgi:hypothetical protein
MQKFDHNIGFWEKRQIFRWNLSKIAQKSDHNIDHRTSFFSKLRLKSFLIVRNCEKWTVDFLNEARTQSYDFCFLTTTTPALY